MIKRHLLRLGFAFHTESLSGVRAFALAVWLGALAAGWTHGAAATNELGMFLYAGKDPSPPMSQAAALGLRVCEIYTEDFSPEMERALREASARHGVRIAALFTMGPGPLAWDFDNGPSQNGLIPSPWRRQRIDRLKQASDFAHRLAIPALETHAGFVPENPKDPLYRELVEALREVVRHCAGNDQTFLYHAGAETAVALLRVIEDVGLKNQGVGLDTANPILYGTGHPVDALEIYGHWLRSVNVKDGLFPTSGRALGKEVPIGQGKVDFPRFVAKLRSLDYRAPIIIEREISGPQLIEDVRQSKVYLEKLLAQ